MILQLVGLIFNTVGAIILIIPQLNTQKKLSDEFITEINPTNKTFTQTKHKKEKLLAVYGLAFMIIGFLLQLSEVLSDKEFVHLF